MELTPALARELATLSASLDDPGTDIAASLTDLVTDVRAAVDSYVGMTLTARHTDRPFTFTILDDDDSPVATSLMLTLSSWDKAEPILSIVLYASTPGAFVDLAADLEWMTSTTPGRVILDAHLKPIPTSPQSASSINQAIGILIGRGHTPHAADRELDNRAITAGTDRAGAADLLLASLNPPGRLPGRQDPDQRDSDARGA